MGDRGQQRERIGKLLVQKPLVKFLGGEKRFKNEVPRFFLQGSLASGNDRPTDGCGFLRSDFKRRLLFKAHLSRCIYKNVSNERGLSFHPRVGSGEESTFCSRTAYPPY